MKCLFFLLFLVSATTLAVPGLLDSTTSHATPSQTELPDSTIIPAPSQTELPDSTTITAPSQTELCDLPEDLLRQVYSILDLGSRIVVGSTCRKNKESVRLTSTEKVVSAAIQADLDTKLQNSEIPKGRRKEIIKHQFEALFTDALVSSEYRTAVALFEKLRAKSQPNALKLAILNDNAEVVHKFLELHKLKLKVNTFKQLVKLAINLKRPPMVQALFEYKRIGHSFDDLGLPLVNARSMQDKDANESLTFAEIVTILLSDGRVDPAFENYRAFHEARRIGNPKIVQAYIESGRIPEKILNDVQVHDDVRAVIQEIANPAK